MKKGLCIVCLLVMNCIPILAYEINVDTIIVVTQEGRTNQIIVSIKNTEEEPLWIWFSDTEDFKDDVSVIKNKIMKRRGDFSLFDIATDPNIEGHMWSYPVNDDDFLTMFVKILRPDNSFSVVFLEKTDNEKNIRKVLINPNKYITIFKQQQVLKNCPGIESEWGGNRISYPFGVVVIPLRWQSGFNN